MSGHSATNMSATSAGSYYRKKFGKDPRPKSMMEPRETAAAGRGFGFDDGRPETPFTGVTYHSSHASQSRPGTSQGREEVNTPGNEGSDPLGGLVQPKQKRSGFFRKMIDTAKTQAANARSTMLDRLADLAHELRAVLRVALQVVQQAGWTATPQLVLKEVLQRDPRTLQKTRASPRSIGYKFVAMSTVPTLLARMSERSVPTDVR
jgi:hypothetical protein